MKNHYTFKFKDLPAFSKKNKKEENPKSRARVFFSYSLVMTSILVKNVTFICPKNIYFVPSYVNGDVVGPEWLRDFEENESYTDSKF